MRVLVRAVVGPGRQTQGGDTRINGRWPSCVGDSPHLRIVCGRLFWTGITSAVCPASARGAAATSPPAPCAPSYPNTPTRNGRALCVWALRIRLACGQAAHTPKVVGATSGAHQTAAIRSGATGLGKRRETIMKRPRSCTSTCEAGVPGLRLLTLRRRGEVLVVTLQLKTDCTRVRRLCFSCSLNMSDCMPCGVCA